MNITRRDALKLASLPLIGGLTASAVQSQLIPARHSGGRVHGRMSGADALVETLMQEGADVVFGIPGAQENELWDSLKTKNLEYLLVTHEFSAATMADGYARSTGKPGVMCIVPGPGLTNALTGLGEALLDSVPIVCIVGDVANGTRARPFQVHCLNQAAILQPVTKQVIQVRTAPEIPLAVRQAFAVARSGEPGPVGVVVPWNLLLELTNFDSLPLAAPAVPWDEPAFRQALALLADRRTRIGIYAGQGCMDCSASLSRVAELLQAPVATSMSGKGVIDENHPLAVGWGYGPQGTRSAEETFRRVDTLLAIGVKFSEVSTGYYSQPQIRNVIHVDVNPENLGRILRTNVCVNADAGLFLSQVLENAETVRRPTNSALVDQIAMRKRDEARLNAQPHSLAGVDPMSFLRALRCASVPDALCFVDVTLSQYWATEVFTANQGRTFFNPTNNQGMGWSIPAALGAQKAHAGRQVFTVTGDGCFLMSAMEISTAAREHLPVKFFVLDDQAYHYMQQLQKPAYMRTTATILAHLDYCSLAAGWGVGYQEVNSNDTLESSIRGILATPGPVLARVMIDYGDRQVRWIDAAKKRFTNELTAPQKAHFLARIGSRSVHTRQVND